MNYLIWEACFRDKVGALNAVNAHKAEPEIYPGESVTNGR